MTIPCITQLSSNTGVPGRTRMLGVKLKATSSTRLTTPRSDPASPILTTSLFLSLNGFVIGTTYCSSDSPASDKIPEIINDRRLSW
jgi:hypothetical protein